MYTYKKTVHINTSKPEAEPNEACQNVMFFEGAELKL